MGDDHHICLFGACLLITQNPYSPKSMFNTPCYICVYNVYIYMCTYMCVSVYGGKISIYSDSVLGSIIDIYSHIL